MRDSLIDSNLKWNWKMEYCKRNNMSPANSTNWDTAEKRYHEIKEEMSKLEHKRST